MVKTGHNLTGEKLKGDYLWFDETSRAENDPASVQMAPLLKMNNS